MIVKRKNINWDVINIWIAFFVFIQIFCIFRKVCFGEYYYTDKVSLLYLKISYFLEQKEILFNEQEEVKIGETIGFIDLIEFETEDSIDSNQINTNESKNSLLALELIESCILKFIG